MYNLFVTGQDDAWEGSSGHYEYDRSRFLEFTVNKIAESFKELTEENINTLKSMPCLFAYEGNGRNAKVGRLISIKERGRLILIEYEFDPSIPPIPFSSIEPIAALLDIRGWEMNRTHWAVKDENLFERLKKASLIIDAIPESEVVRPVQQVDVDSFTINTVQAFIDKVLSIKPEFESEVFYRGHSDKKKYKLEPSLFRKDEDGNYIYLQNEHIIYRELIVSNAVDFSEDEYTLDKLVRMQHYSLPTRLLDITSNPLIGLYFACKSKYGKKENGKFIGEADGEVIIFTLPREQVKYFDSDTASCIANLVRLPKNEKDQISSTIKTDEQDFNNELAVKRLMHFIREEKSFFEPRIIPTDLQRVICVKGKMSNDRINSQSGAFLLFGLDAVLDEKGTPDIVVQRILVKNKAAILDELDRLNINESTVFPYIENSALYIAKKYAFSSQ